MRRGTATRYLYVVRHGQAEGEEDAPLTETGRRQATLLGERLRDVPFAAVHHGPLPRATQTARLIGEQLGAHVPLHASDVAGDYVPHLPERHELPEDCADFFLDHLSGVDKEEAAEGARLAQEALDRFTGPVTDGAEDRHELLVTHSFLVAWLVRDALDAPAWRWLGLNPGNAALTVIRYAPGRPAGVLVLNDVSHLPDELRWTDFPDALRV
ncbi:histidine phosphatase family protein [Streptomyces sp. NPDC050145]|uniref:histidine phosphatase family protein n=1 Tax=Streptomyces sp. NPDC050145 TaxID=3365602 RepID=UPI0037B18EF3